jgi:phospholipase/carboxylesterase
VDDFSVWSRADDGSSPLVVLLQGQGGTEQDLAPLFPLLPDRVVAVSLRAPHPEGDGFSWFRVPEHVRDAEASHVAPAADAVHRWIASRASGRTDAHDSAGADTGASSNVSNASESEVARDRSEARDGSDGRSDEVSSRRPVAVVGYSQGGAVAIHLLRRQPRAIDTAVIIAGFLGIGEEPGDDELLEVRPPVYWMRGLRDESITLMDVQRVAYFLPPHTTLTTAEHPLLDHELSETFLAAAGRFLTAWAAGLGPR